MGEPPNALSAQIIRLTLCGLAGCVLLSWPLWGIGDRSFPCLPVFGEAVEQAGILQPMLFGGMCTLLIGGIVRPSKAFLLPLILLLLGMCALDLNRMQPWLWFYLLVLALVFLEKNTAPAALRWLLAAVYCWSGMNKLTPYFAEENFPWFCEAFQATGFLGQYSTLGYAVAVFETGLGVLLLWPDVSKRLRWIFVIFHGTVILILLKSQWNYVVLPWNVAMAAMAFILHSHPFEWRDTLRNGQKALLLVAWLTPLAGLFHLWPYQLSWQMYSNTQSEATFYSPAPCEKTGPVWGEKSFDEGRRLLLDDWAFASIQVPMFYSDRTFRQMGRYLCRCVPEADSSSLLILRVHPWDKNAEHTEVISCQELEVE